MRAVLVNLYDLDEELGELPISGGSLSFSYYSQTKTSGSVEVADVSAIGNNLVRVSDGERVLGTYFPTIPEVDKANGMNAATVDLASTLVRLRDDALPWSLTIPAGTNAITSAASVLDYDMEPYRVDGETEAQQAATLPSAVELECGTSRLTQANSALTAAGHAGLSVDPMGNAVVSWYKAPSERGVKFHLSASDIGASYTAERDASCPSAVYYTSGTDDAELYGGAELAEGDPMRFDVVGRRIVEVYRANGDATEAKLAAMALVQLASEREGAEKITATHMLMPLSVGDTGTLEIADGLWMVENIEIDLKTAVCTTTLGKVAAYA